MNFTSVRSLTWSVKRTWKPTWSPSWVSSSSATRRATERAASRRGWVQPISPASPRPAARQSLGSCVVLPEPVSPATTTTWCSRISLTISSARAAIGSDSSSRIAGFAAARARRFAAEASMSAASAASFFSSGRFDSPRQRPSRRPKSRLHAPSSARRRSRSVVARAVGGRGASFMQPYMIAGASSATR